MKNSIKIFLILVFAGLSVNGFAQKIGHISFVELIQAMPETATVNKELEALSKTYEEEIETLEVGLRNEYVAYESARATMTEAAATEKFDQLSVSSEKLNTRKAEVEQEFQKKQDEMLEPIFKKAQETIDKVAKANGVACILNSQVILFADDATSFDLLPLIKKELGIQ